MSDQVKPVVLISLDGWGATPVEDGNAIEAANTVNMDRLMKNYPFTFVEASGISVGLPWGEVGNSEVGHLNLGAGQVIYQNLPRIQLSIQDGTFQKNEEFLKAIQHVKKNKSQLHLMGILSSGGVHGHMDHCFELVKMCKENKLKKNVFVHAITDGRDTPAAVADQFVTELLEVMKKNKVGQLASMVGRYYAMDRNNNWDRTKLAYDLMVKGAGLHHKDPLEAIRSLYAQDMKDEQLQPIVLVDKKDNPVTTVKPGDAVIFWNYRPDRARQITKAFVQDEIDGFERGEKIDPLVFVTMMEYESGLPTGVAFPPKLVKEPVGKIVSQAGLKQLRLAETEKYAHVTYFFNGGSEDQYEGEERALIQSPNVATYDLKPEMSAPEIAERAVKEIESGKYDFIMMNFANADMVGHTGKFDAAVKGVEAVDDGVGKIADAVLAKGGAVVITADHGNAEQMKDPLKGTEVKEHSTDPVPLIVIQESRKRELDDATFDALRKQTTPIGILGDVGPTVLELLGLDPSPEMTGRSLLNDVA